MRVGACSTCLVVYSLYCELKKGCWPGVLRLVYTRSFVSCPIPRALCLSSLETYCSENYNILLSRG